MNRKDEFIAAMVNSLDPEGIEFFATAHGDRLETLKVGFLAYVRGEIQYDDATNQMLFESFIEKVRDVYSKLKVH